MRKGTHFTFEYYDAESADHFCAAVSEPCSAKDLLTLSDFTCSPISVSYVILHKNQTFPSCAYRITKFALTNL
jgi:hypothetical protein